MLILNEYGVDISHKCSKGKRHTCKKQFNLKIKYNCNLREIIESLRVTRKKRHGFCFISKLQLKFLRTYKRLWFFLSRTRKKNYNFLMKVIWNSFSSSLALGSWWSNFTKSAMDSDLSQLWNSYFSVITGYIAPPWNSTKIIKLWQTFGVVSLLICFFALH